MNDVSTQITIVAIAWIATLLAILRLSTRSAQGSVGLPLAFVLTTTFFYIGAFTFIDPNYSHLRDDGSLYLLHYDFTPRTVLWGIEATLLSIACFAVGCWAAETTISLQNPHGQPQQIVSQPIPAQVSLPTAIRWLSILGAFGILMGVSGARFPLVDAFRVTLQNLATIVVCLGLKSTYSTLNAGRFVFWIGCALILPLVYLLVFGFLAYGFLVAMIYCSFWLSSISKRPIGMMHFLINASIITVAILPLFVLWMQVRFVVRDAEDPIQRASILVDAVATLGQLSDDGYRYIAFDFMNSRLNQAVFVGKTIEEHQMRPSLVLYGETIKYVPFAWVPRFIWPEKPEMGSSKLLSDQTGIEVSPTTTFGAGSVLELYANFEYPGIVIGSFLLGLIIRWIDLRAAASLHRSQFLDFARWMCVGIPFVAPLTDIFIMFNGVVIAWIVTTVLKSTLMQHQTSPSG